MALLSLGTRSMPADAIPALHRRAVLIALSALALVAGLAPWDMSSSAAAASADPELAMLMRFMAAIKGAMALAAVALIAWRAGYPASTRLALAYAATAAMLMSGTGWIWLIDTVIEGAIAFHGGLGLFIALACLDKEGQHAISRSVAGRRGALQRLP